LIVFSALTAYKLLYKKQRKPIGTVNNAFVMEVVRKDMPVNAHIQLTDTEYRIFKVSDVGDFFNDYKPALPYQKDFYDCDNMAFDFYTSAERAMPGCMVGVGFYVTPGGAHAVNIFVDENRGEWLFDVGNKQAFAQPKDWFPTFKLI
jgi:hypothetical protein